MDQTVDLLFLIAIVLKRRSTRFWNIGVEIWAHSDTRASMRSGSDVGAKRPGS